MKLFSKPYWAKAKGANKTAKRLKLVPQSDNNCDSHEFKTQGGCRKHVYQRYGWFYYFDEKRNTVEVMPDKLFHYSQLKRKTRSYTTSMPLFSADTSISLKFQKWLASTGGGAKDLTQATLIARKILKYLKYCCADTGDNWDVPDNVVDYCLGSKEMLSNFLDFLGDK